MGSLRWKLIFMPLVSEFRTYSKHFNSYIITILQDEYEEVDIITKDGNYGWRVYEGPNLYTPRESPGGNTSANSINAIFPVMGYYHDVNVNEGSASITGGYFYRSMTDPCMHGR